ncbi:MAG: hypothetical protein IJ153_07675 [Clostridia bacterium]|nr:hypothetical protein [Clostridia bacterium]
MRAYIIERNREARKADLEKQLLSALQECQWQAEVLHASKEAEPAGNAAEGLLQAAETLGEEEYCLLIPENILGPIGSLQDLELRLRGSNQSALLLARGSGLVALKKEAFRSAALRQWISQGMDPEALDQLISAELYDTTELRKLAENPLLDLPEVMVRQLGFPFFSLEVFQRSFANAVQTTLGNQARLLLKELGNRGYDTAPLMKYLIRSCHQGELLRNLQLFYVLPSSERQGAPAAKDSSKKRIVLGMHLYYTDLFPQSRAYAERFPEETDIIITTSDADRKKKIEAEFAKVRCHSLDVRVIQNRGRDVSSLLVGMRDVVDWEYVCYYHDKKTLQTKPGTIGVGFAYQCAENLFASKDYVQNVIHLFDREKCLGMLSPPPPNHADYYFTMGLPWGPNWDVSYELYTRLGLTVPIAIDQAPVAPLGTCFWFRGAALRDLMDRNWAYEDFPPEPNGTDGTLLHAFERMYSFCVQEAGYYPAYLCSDRFAANLRTTLAYYVRNYNQVAAEAGILNKTEEMIKATEARMRRSVGS